MLMNIINNRVTLVNPPVGLPLNGYPAYGFDGDRNQHTCSHTV